VIRIARITPRFNPLSKLASASLQLGVFAFVSECEMGEDICSGEPGKRPFSHRVKDRLTVMRCDCGSSLDVAGY